MIGAQSQWVTLTPFTKQCWVTAGVSLNMIQLALCFGISSTLVPALRAPDSPIPIDDNMGSWVASLPAICLLIGNVSVPPIMARLGRKVANLSSVLIQVVGWGLIVFATDIATLLAARCLHGVGMGMISCLGPVLIGEYTSPTNRGVFLMAISVVLGLGVLFIHTLGLYLSWQTVSLTCVGITLIDLVIIIFSPESPIWLASQSRYDECRFVFHWLRGDSEDDELLKLINASVIANKALEEQRNNTDTVMIKFKKKIGFIRDTIGKVEFYLPIIIMFNIYSLCQWSSVNMLTSYAVDLIQLVVGEDVDVTMIIISLDTQRALSTAIAVIVIKTMKRRKMLFWSVGVNILALVAIAAYVFARSRDLMPFDSLYVGVALVHVLMFSVAIGALPMGFVLAGEMFPFQYKSLAGGISVLCFSVNVFISVKTIPFLLNNLDLYGTLLLYACLEIFFLIVVGMLLPETKDRTLQDIEEEFKSRKKPSQVIERFRSKPDLV